MTTPLPDLPIKSVSEALRSNEPCLIPMGPDFYFIFDEERPDRLYSEGLLPTPRRFS